MTSYTCILTEEYVAVEVRKLIKFDYVGPRRIRHEILNKVKVRTPLGYKNRVEVWAVDMFTLNTG
jgi:hypothetical protein